MSLPTKQPLLTDRDFFASLHGLRGIAVLFVVLSHLGISGLFLLPIPHYAIGKVGVWIFFVLSAFLLTTHLCHDLETTTSRISSVLQYTVHRIFRIYPLFIFVLIIHLILGDISRMDLIHHLLLIQGKGELWAIPVEFQYYFIMPVIAISALYLKRSHAIFILMAAITVVMIYCIAQPTKVFANELSIIPKLTPFLLGSILALLLYKKSFTPTKPKHWFAFLLPTLCVVTLLIETILYRSMSLKQISTTISPWLSLAIGLSVMGLIYSALQLPAIGKLLGAKSLVFLGKISFSVYLLHLIIIRFVQKIHNVPPVYKAWLSLGLIILCASITYWAIERHGIRAGKNISQKLRHKLQSLRKLN